MNSSKHHPFSRREIVGAGGIGLAAAASPAFAQNSAPASASPNPGPETEGLQNPVDKYPKPPFPKQSQPWPGLASKMDPRPDHGETSYRGAGRLAGRKALITGGDSGMGRAAAIAYAREGADVAINHLPEEEPDAREVAGGRVCPFPATFATRPSANAWSIRPCRGSAASTSWS
jgi:hypothetical protein